MRNMMWCAVLAGALFCAGCSTVAPGSDPVVVRAEQVTLIAADTIDAFLRFERANQASLGADVHAVAQSLRHEAPRAIRSARLATKTFKANRSPGNKATMETALAVLNAMAGQALAALQTESARIAQPMANAAGGAGVLIAIQAVLALLAWINKERERLQQTGELTAEEELKIDLELDLMFTSEHWKE
jgi:hypothetical protein